MDILTEEQEFRDTETLIVTPAPFRFIFSLLQSSAISAVNLQIISSGFN